MKVFKLKMKKILLVTVTCLCMVLVTGCASVISDNNYDVKISTNAPKATVTVRKLSTGVVLSQGKAPLVVYLKPGDGFLTSASYQVEVKDDATREKQTQIINARFNGWFLGNFIFGGIIGMAVDGATGAMYYLDKQYYVYFSEYDN